VDEEDNLNIGNEDWSVDNWHEGAEPEAETDQVGMTVDQGPKGTESGWVEKDSNVVSENNNIDLEREDWDEMQVDQEPVILTTNDSEFVGLNEEVNYPMEDLMEETNKVRKADEESKESNNSEEEDRILPFSENFMLGIRSKLDLRKRPWSGTTRR
jgi:hypothetical protein